MVLPIGFFMPLPLAMMIPFMGIQSAVMAKQFGENFQYGKRRISAMSNEEFNKLTPSILMQRANEELKSMIPSMEQSITEMREFQKFIVSEFIGMINELIRAGFGKILGLGEDQLTGIEHFMHGHISGHETTTTVAPTETPVITPEGELAPPPREFPSSEPVPTVLPKAGAIQIDARNALIKIIASWASFEVKYRNLYFALDARAQLLQKDGNTGYYRSWQYNKSGRIKAQATLTKLLQSYTWN